MSIIFPGTSVNGEAKRDYPASIFYQSPWYKEYRMIEDHFARVNTALTRGKARVRIGVVHPIESYWLHYGPKGQELPPDQGRDGKQIPEPDGMAPFLPAGF